MLKWPSHAGCFCRQDHQPHASALWNRVTPLLRPSAYLNLRKDAPHQHLQNLLNAFLGSGKSGPRLMCSGPCSLSTCLLYCAASIESAGECCDQNTQSRFPSMWLTMLFSKQSKRMPAKALEPRTAMRSWRQLSQPVCSSFYSTSEHSREPVCRGLRGRVDPALGTC